jgi:hypothetical protein
MNIKQKHGRIRQKAISKKKYITPCIHTEKIFEKNALACGKTEPQTTGCMVSLKLS